MYRKLPFWEQNMLNMLEKMGAGNSWRSVLTCLEQIIRDQYLPEDMEWKFSNIGNMVFGNFGILKTWKRETLKFKIIRFENKILKS